MVDTASFQLSPSQLGDVRDRLIAAIRDGLATEGQQVAALPAYLTPPKPKLAGEALVVDTGGTNMRGAWIELRGDAPAVIKKGPISKRLEVRGKNQVDRRAFFRMQAELVEALDAPKGLPVGYCFSYPSEVLPSLDARLIKWTKGIDLPDVVDTLVGQGLFDALSTVEPLDVRVLNDTVAALLAASLVAEGGSQNAVGLIAGTGTNMACYTDAEHAPKLTKTGAVGRMALNLESGNFHPPHLNEADEIVDRGSINPGEQRFEKAVSGFYLPFIFRAALPGRDSFNPTAGTQALVDIIEQEPGTDDAKLATAIIDRAADLVGAGLAAIISTYDPGEPTTIVAEGSLFWRGPGFAERAQATLKSLLPPGVRFRVERIAEANLFGAAAAALSR